MDLGASYITLKTLTLLNVTCVELNIIREHTIMTFFTLTVEYFDSTFLIKFVVAISSHRSLVISLHLLLFASTSI